MELKVWIDGSAREVCGVTEKTTCEEVIFALAQAASLPGFYTLVAQWRGNEITLAPDENPLGVIKQLGENPNSFELTLRRLGNPWSPSRSHGGSGQRSGSSYKAQAQAPNIPQHKKSSNEHAHQNHPVVPKHHDKSLKSSHHKQKYSEEVKMKKDLCDQLSQQEQLLEQNKMHLLKLEHELNLGAQNSYAQNSNQQLYANTGADLLESVGPAAELHQLAGTTWTDLIEKYKKKNEQLTQEKYHMEFSIKDLDRQIDEINRQIVVQEERVTNALDDLLDDLDLFNQRRANILGLSSSANIRGSSVTPISSRVTAEVIRSPGGAGMHHHPKQMPPTSGAPSNSSSGGVMI